MDIYKIVVLTATAMERYTDRIDKQCGFFTKESGYSRTLKWMARTFS
jgi:hypothetical protein